MYTALYYPHTMLRDDDLIKAALLLWDKLEFIVPSEGWVLGSGSSDYAEAMELVGQPRVPSIEEKQMAHNIVLALANSPLAEWFAFDPTNETLRYHIYGDKLLPETWSALRESQLAEKSDFDDYMLNKWLGLTVMSILAEVCAGTQRRLITDEVDSYTALNKYFAISLPRPFTRQDQREAVTELTLSIFDTKKINFKRLLALRKEEESGKDTFLRALRHKYLSEVDAFVREATKESRTRSDLEELNRVFMQKVQGELDQLKRILRLEALSTILSKEVLVAVIGAGATAVEPLSGSLLTMGAFGRAIVENRKRRRDTLKKHAASWLYLLQHRVLL